MVVLKLRAGGAISPCRWCSGGGIHNYDGLAPEAFMLAWNEVLEELSPVVAKTVGSDDSGNAAM